MKDDLLFTVQQLFGFGDVTNIGYSAGVSNRNKSLALPGR